METKPDILNPKSDSEPPRVVLESSDSKSYTIRDIHKDGQPSAPALQATYATPPPHDDIVSYNIKHIQYISTYKFESQSL
ncbi:hypothetical protein RR48_00673 [Papilio machaon]|uniref:Uncharacterized protein n=1 Tax=Papilio machaon TaxID=76193 RepID=A0A0N0PFL1_PAPMA|nr:hypothetical protein RR48_00673 [Papilio machaon]